MRRCPTRITPSVVDRESGFLPRFGVTRDVEARKHGHADQPRVLVELGQDPFARAGRQAQHDLGDADRLVVLELARIREPCRTGRSAASRDRGRALRTRGEIGQRGAHARTADRDPAVGVLGDVREQLRTRRAADQHRRSAGLRGLGPRPRRREVHVLARRRTRRRRATAPASRACARARRRAAPSWRRRGRPARPRSSRSRCRTRTGRPIARSRVATSLAVTIGSRCATRQMPVPTRDARSWPRPSTARRTDRACACTHRAARRHPSAAASGARSGCACARGCTASTTPAPRPHAPSSTGPIVRSVMNIVTP